MTQEATITKLLTNGMAEIAVRRESACGGNCHACGGTCTTNNLLKVSAKNNASASVGDKVMVSSSTSRVLTAAVAVYVVPLILFFVFYAATAMLSFPENVSVISSIFGFGIGIVLAMMLNRWFKNKSVTTFEIVSIL